MLLQKWTPLKSGDLFYFDPTRKWRAKELKEKWDKPIHNFKTIQLQLIEIFGDRYTRYLDVN